MFSPGSIAHILLTTLVYSAIGIDGQRHVDNVLKMLLGVLSVTGLFVLAGPQHDPVPAEEAVVPAAAPQPEIAPTPSPAPAMSSSPVNFTSAPDFQIGAPSIDGRPLDPKFGMPFGMSAQSQTPDADTSPLGQGEYTPTPFIMPGSEASLPPNATADGAQNSAPLPKTLGFTARSSHHRPRGSYR